MTDVRFSFGDNWNKYLDAMPAAAARAMAQYFDDWVPDGIAGRTVVDVGSGSGLMSLVAHELGARVTSFDADPASVAATCRLWDRAGAPTSWSVLHGSILDRPFVESLGTFDIVVSWGVLHHTGSLWAALGNAAVLVAPGGELWIALYTKTPQSGRSLRTKQLYNRSPDALKPVIRGFYAAAKVSKHLMVHRNLDRLRHYADERGMDWRRDIEDWLGGLPYEVSSPGEVHAFLRPRGFTLERLQSAIGEGGNDVYLYRADGLA